MRTGDLVWTQVRLSLGLRSEGSSSKNKVRGTWSCYEGIYRIAGSAWTMVTKWKESHRWSKNTREVE